MKILTYILLIFIILSGFFKQDKASHVIMIGVDGLSPIGIRGIDTPNLDMLMENGSYSMNARSVLPSSSGSNWATMIMGAGPEVHGVTSNAWRPDDFQLPPAVADSNGLFPTIFSVIRHHKPQAEIGVIYHWGGFGKYYDKAAPNYDVHGRTADETTRLTVEYINEKKPLFTFVHLDHVDAALHGSGFATEDYFKAVVNADSLIGLIIQATKDAGIFDDTVFIIGSDHGGLGTGHGGETYNEATIPFIVSGKSIRKNHSLQSQIYQFDKPATALYALGIPQPQAWVGRPALEAFVGFNDSDLNAPFQQLLEAPLLTTQPEIPLLALPGGLFDTDAVIVAIEPTLDDAEIRFTLDGSVPTRNSDLYTAPLTITEDTVVLAKQFTSQKQSNQQSVDIRFISDNENNGIRYTYYESENLELLPLDYSRLTPIKTGVVPEFDLDFIDNRPYQFLVVFEGMIEITESGSHRFYTYSDDGSKLFINGRLVVDNDGSHGPRVRKGSIELEPGLHNIRLEYFNGGGGYWLTTYFTEPSGTRRVIPTSRLFNN